MLCKPVQLRELGEQSDCVFGSCSGGIGSVSSKPSPALLCSALPLCSHTHTPRLPLAPLWALPAAGLGAGAGGAQQRAAIWLRGGQVRAGTRPLPSSSVSCLQLNITAWASQDGGFLHMERLRLSGQSTEHRLPTYGPGTRYVVAVRGLTAAGPGAASLWESHTNGSETPGPPHGCSRLVLDTSPSQGTAVLPLHPISQPPEAVSEHQLLVAVTHNSTVLEDACSGELQPSNHSHPPDPYVAAVLNLSAPTDFVLGDGTRGHGFHNAPLHPGWDYSALLRLARRSPQAETFTCVCYSFSMVAGQSSYPWPGIVIGVVVLLVLVLVFAGIVWFVLSRRRKSVSVKAKENN